MTERIVLFDGVCVFCNGSVNFIIRNDPGGVFKFCPMQSGKGQALLARHGFSTEYTESLVLLEGDRAYSHSTAALRIARRLRRGWPLLYAFMVVPRFVRDFFYGLVAQNRYKLFGKQDACMMPTPEIRGRFLRDE